MSDLLKTSQVAALWRVGERRAREILGELAAYGFHLEPDAAGTRLCPPRLAEAVRACRERKADLATLVTDPEMAPYLARGAAADDADPLAMLIHAVAEIGIVREVVGRGVVALTAGVSAMSHRPIDWTAASLPNPKTRL